MTSLGPVFSRFVALGDSTTEGLDDPYPGGRVGHEVYRGWADRLAERLAAINPDLHYANLAIRGRQIAGIEQTQLEPAVAMQPDLASVVGGVNDLLRPKVDLDEVAARMQSMQTKLIAQGATVISMTLPDLASSMRVARLVSERLKIYNQHMRDVAARTGAVVVDLARELAVYDPRGWSADRLHASADGHEMIAIAAARELGVPGADEQLAALRQDIPRPPLRPPLKAAGDEALWVWTHLRPWIVRRVRGTSSGDGVAPKRPSMELFLERSVATE
ncbi:MAG: SGNH/GDSL hydrolase family protein [Solirubrobacterales bacterium]